MPALPVATSRPQTDMITGVLMGAEALLRWHHPTRGLITPGIFVPIAEDVGIKLITIHGRTRCQFYTGKADWKAIRAVREAISIPLVANGDGQSADDAKAMMEVSGADAVMFGRSAYGRPWWPGAVAEELSPGTGKAAPTLKAERDIALWHQQETLSLYGASLGNKTYRKHLGWLFTRLHERLLISLEHLQSLRATLLSQSDNAKVTHGIKHLFSTLEDAA